MQDVDEVQEKPLRLLFVGQAPSRETNGLPPFVGRCGKFLADLIGVDQATMLASHDFRNVLDRWPGKGVGGDLFPMKESRVAAKELLAKECPGRAVVLLGNNVARAFGLKAFKYLELYQVKDPEDPAKVSVPLLTVVPHPSGRNHFFNRVENRAAVAKFLRALAASKLERSETVR
jgi:uracil-DNA glycosylase